MGEADSRKLEFKLDERERRFAEKVRETLEKHIEQRMRLKVYTEDITKDGWIWAIGQEWLTRWEPGSWVDSVFAHPDGKIYVIDGWTDVDDLIEDLHPKIFKRLFEKTDDEARSIEELNKTIGELQDRNNWKRYQRIFPKVIRFFRESEKVADEITKDHNVKVEFWLNPDRCGVQAVLDTKGMNEDQKLEAIMGAATALKDFNDRLYSGK